MKSVLTFIFISLIFTPFLSAQEVLPYDIDLTLETSKQYLSYEDQRKINKVNSISDEAYARMCNNALQNIANIPTQSEQAFLDYSIKTYAPSNLKLTPQKAKKDKLFIAYLYYTYRKLLNNVSNFARNPRSCSSANTESKDCIAAVKCNQEISKKYFAIKKYMNPLPFTFYKQEKDAFNKQFKGDYQYEKRPVCWEGDREYGKCDCPDNNEVSELRSDFKFTNLSDDTFIAQYMPMKSIEPLYITGNNLPLFDDGTLKYTIYLQADGEKNFINDGGEIRTLCGYKLLDSKKITPLLDNNYFYPQFNVIFFKKLCALSADWKGIDCAYYRSEK